MAYTNTAYRLYYAVAGYVSGLTDVRYYVYKPNGVKLGAYLMTELNNVTAKGIYYDDFLDADIEGNYLFIANSPSHPKQDEKTVVFEHQIWQAGDRNIILTQLADIKDIEKGNWEIVNNQMIFKRENGTELLRFNLYNKMGGLTDGENNGVPFKRIKV